MATTNNSANTQIVVSAAGAINYPVQPAFSAYLSATTGGVTGDGTVATVIADTIVSNQSSSYNNGTGVFTAPVAGLYRFGFEIACGAVAAGHTSIIVNAVATARTFQILKMNPGIFRGSGGAIAFPASIFVVMALGDTLSFTIKVSGSTKTVTLVGGAARTRMSGYLIA